MTSKLWRRLNHVKCLTWLIFHLALLALHTIQSVQGMLIMPVQGTSSQLTLSRVSILQTNTPSLVSSSGTFALGFFSSSTDATRFGLGIWYNIKLAPGIQTVVWMPQPDANLSAAASLQLSTSGVLQLLDTLSGTRQLVWSSSNNLPGSVLELQDDGNLVLLNATSSVIWQSFDSPTDTLLPGQVLRATMNRPLVSWRGVDDWAKGPYFCAWMPINGTVSLTLYWNGLSIDQWNRSSWSTTNVTIANNVTVYPYLNSFPLSDYIYLDRANGSFYAGNESFASLVMSSASNIQGPLRRVTLDRDGLLRLYSWTANTNAWDVDGIWAPPGVNGLCAVFAECGPYGLCTLDPSSPAYFATCSCPDGFELIDRNDQFKGCKRKYEIPPGVCAANTTKLNLIKVGELDFPFASRLYPSAIMNETECKQLCLNDCRCAGAVFWRRTGQCYMKSEPLFNGGFPQDIGNHSAYLKVLDSPLYFSSTDHRRKVDVIMGTTVGVGAALVCLGMAFCVWRRWLKRSSMQLHPKFAMLGMYPRKFTFRELSAATGSFSQSELIGSGGMGSVYKATLKPTGAIVAVKRIRHEARGSEEGFLAEASSISQIRHRNLVQLKGWCIEDGRLLLVYDYMSNGSLDQWLHESHRSESSRHPLRATAKELSWSLRYSVLTQIAAALEYLHEDWQQCVLHRDVKSANVLLDAEFNAHLGDFGLARLIDHQKMEKTTLMAGTLGYMAPEMPYTGKATKETDVYSFGVLMLEVVCGKKPVDNSAGDQDSFEEPGVVVLLHLVQRAHKEGNLLATVDPRLRITADRDYNSLNGNSKQSEPDHDAAEADVAVALSRRMEEEVKVREEEQQTLVLKLGLLCCFPHPSARPSMRLVHRILVTGDATAIPALPDTTQWTHHDVLDASRGGFGYPRPLQGSMSLSSTPLSFHPVTEVHE